MPEDGGSNGQRSSLILGPRDRLTGSLYVEGDLVVAGTVDGELEVTGDVEIDGGGRVNGPVTARQRLVVGPSGWLLGDVRVSRLVVSDGAKFSGNVSMVKPGDVAARALEARTATSEPVTAVAAAPAASMPPEPAPVTPAVEAAKPASSEAKAARTEAWQLVRPKSKQSNYRKGKRR